MANTIKFTEEELKQIQELQNHYGQITMAMGQLVISRLNLDTREKSIKETLQDTRNKEQEMAAALNEKYGKGTLDIESGDFTPEETPETPKIPEVTS